MHAQPLSLINCCAFDPWSVVLVDDSMQVMESRFIDFLHSCFLEINWHVLYLSTYTCIILALLHPSVHLASYREYRLLWLSSKYYISQAISLLFVPEAFDICTSYQYIYISWLLLHACTIFVNLLFWFPHYGGCGESEISVIISLGIIKMFLAGELWDISKQETPFVCMQAI